MASDSGTMMRENIVDSLESMKKFDYSQDWQHINFRVSREKYQIGKGEQGVLLVEPYKSEILPYWRFRTPEIAKKSAQKIYELFLEYKRSADFVGMDMARKFLQMGYTRSRRYANHPSGKKYASNPQKESDPRKRKQALKKVLPQAEDWKTSPKAVSAKLFYERYLLAKNDPVYQNLKETHVRFQKKI